MTKARLGLAAARRRSRGGCLGRGLFDGLGKGKRLDQARLGGSLARAAFLAEVGALDTPPFPPIASLSRKRRRAVTVRCPQARFCVRASFWTILTQLSSEGKHREKP
jgi:hypothetical protein